MKLWKDRILAEDPGESVEVTAYDEGIWLALHLEGAMASITLGSEEARYVAQSLQGAAEAWENRS